MSLLSTKNAAATVRSFFSFLTSPRLDHTHALAREGNSQSSSGVSSSRLSDIGSYEDDDEDDEEELKSHVRGVMNLFLSNIAYAFPPPRPLDMTLIERVVARTSPWIEHTGDSIKWRRVCEQSTAMANMSYGGQRLEVREQIALFTWFMIYIDDTAERDPSSLALFQQGLLFSNTIPTSTISSDPILKNFSLHLNDMYTLYDTISANCIITATLEFVNGCVLETMEDVTNMSIQRTQHNLYPYYLRSKTGVAPAYAFMLFPREENPKLESYLEAIPELCVFIDKTNDVLSFYKEELAGEKLNYIHNRARCALPPSNQSNSVPQELLYDTLDNVAAEASGNAQRISSILGTKGGVAERAWRVFKDGYVEFHMSQTRYKLDQVALQ